MTDGQASSSSVQFSIRGVMLVTVLAGLLCASLAPVLRGWSAEKRLMFLSFFVVEVLLSAVIVALFSLRRRRVEQICGDVLLRVRRRSSLMLYTYYTLLGGLMTAALAFWAYSFVEDLSGSWRGASIAIVGAAAPIVLIPQAVVFLWWGPHVWSVELRQRGLVYYGWRCRRWSEFLGYAWLDDARTVLQIEVRGATIAARVRADQQQELTRILDDIHTRGGQLGE